MLPLVKACFHFPSVKKTLTSIEKYPEKLRKGLMHFFFLENGMLHILDRNMRIKPRPEKFQESVQKYDVILTCEEKCYDLVVERFESDESSHSHLAHVINLDIVSCLVQFCLQ